ncbi:MAG TPA: ABC transporter permease [Gemmatimonadaceae bacterium]|nr:ABC transporter permease [Gemmatimonadaceae bacterium]
MAPSSPRPGWRRLLHSLRSDIRGDVRAELSFHLEMRTADLVASGLSRDEARAEAERQFGDMLLIRDECITIDERRERRVHRTEMIGDMWNDLRFALRTFRRSPGFTSAVIATLALGIGASTAMFSLVDSTLLRPLPFHEPDDIVVLWGIKQPEGDIRGASFPEIADWRSMNHTLTDVALFDPISLNLRTTAEPVRLSGEMVSGGFFQLIGARAALGRTILPSDDDAPDAHPVAVISDALWHERFAGDSAIIGRIITLNDRALTVIGVMPPGFTGLSFAADVWVPSMMISLTSPASIIERRGTRWLMAVGRLKPGVTMADAQRDIDGVAARLTQSYPETNTDRGVRLMSLEENYLGSTRSLLFTLFGAVFLFLLIACVNVTSLQLVRGIARRREIAVRMAIGADRARLVRQLLVEGVVLAIAGGVVGALVAWLGVRAMTPLIPDGLLPAYAHPEVNGRALAFGLGVAVFAGVIFGVVPAFRSARRDISTALREAGASNSGLARIGRAGAHQFLVVGQIAIALVLLAGAGLMLRSLRHQLAVSPGFRPDGVLGARLNLPAERYDSDARIAFANQLIDRLESLPSVESAAMSSDLPFGGSSSAAILRLPEGDEDGVRFYRHAGSPSYFATLGIPIIRGRSFTTTDTKGSPEVAVISDAMAKRFWPNADPIGQHFRIGGADGPQMTVVGVAGTVRYRDLTTNLAAPGSEPDVYFPLAQHPASAMEISVRQKGSSPLSLATLQREVAALDPSLPIYDVRQLSSDLRTQSATGRFGSLTLGVFSAVALILAAIGIYGVVAFVVGRSRREIAIRMALGARATSVVRLILRGGLLLTTAGVLLGVAGAFATSRVLRDQLFEVSATDPITFSSVALLVLLVALSATYLPARRATRVEVQRVLREE